MENKVLLCLSWLNPIRQVATVLSLLLYTQKCWQYWRIKLLPKCNPVRYFNSVLIPLKIFSPIFSGSWDFGWFSPKGWRLCFHEISHHDPLFCCPWWTSAFNSSQEFCLCHDHGFVKTPILESVSNNKIGLWFLSFLNVTPEAERIFYFTFPI